MDGTSVVKGRYCHYFYEWLLRVDDIFGQGNAKLLVEMLVFFTWLFFLFTANGNISKVGHSNGTSMEYLFLRPVQPLLVMLHCTFVSISLTAPP